MRKTLLFAAGLGVCTTLVALAQDPATPPTTAPATQKAAPTTQEVIERVSYGLAHNFSSQLANDTKGFDVELNMDAIHKGLDDGFAGTPPKYTREEIVEAFQILNTTVGQREAEKQRVAGEKATAAGKAFLEANKSAPGVKTTASGLQYQIIQEGTGPQPKITDTVKVNYTGTLVDGTKFDSSADHGRPAEFPLNGVIEGWGEAFQLLKVGSKAKLFIPADLAYGAQSPDPRTIPPNSTLIFEVELLEILPAVTEPVAPEAPATGPAQMP